MASVVDIYNMALGMLGHTQTVSATDEQSKPARVCSTYYEACRDEMLAMVEWPFATAFQDLALLTSVPTSEWANAFDYPSDCLKARSIVSGRRREHSNDQISFTIASQSSGRKMILCDEEQPKLCFTRLIEDPESYPPMFVNALAACLAYRIAMPLSSEPKILTQALELYNIELNRAIAMELDEGKEDEPPESEFATERLR